MDVDADELYPNHRRRPARAKVPTSDGLDAKVVVMGNTAVGKTSLVQRYTENKFTPSSLQSTTGAFFVTKKVVVNGLKVRLQLWDTAGQERFRSMAPMYYRGANAAILVYDITDASTFNDVRVWLQELKQNNAASEDLIIYIVGAKADLTRHRAISLDQARHSLHMWFPPARKIVPPPPPPLQPTFSYIRPRFTSLTTSRTVPSPTTSSIATSPSPSPLNRAVSARNAVGEKPVSGRRRPGFGTSGLRERRWSDAMRELDEQAEDSPSSFQTSDNPQEDDDDDDDDETSYGLEKGMELFEVSAKDNHGVQALFAHLITNIIRRRDVIEREKDLRTRDSIALSSVSVPTWGNVADNGDQATSAASSPRTGGWSCCST